MESDLYDGSAYETLDVLENSVNFKLPFTRDVHADYDHEYSGLLRNSSLEDWEQQNLLLDDKTVDDEIARSSLCNSPSSTSSSSSAQQQQTLLEQTNYFINDRPETPLEAVKFDAINHSEFGNELEDLGFPLSETCPDIYLNNTSFEEPPQLEFDDLSGIDFSLTNPYDYIVSDLNDKDVNITEESSSILNSPITNKRKRLVKDTTSINNFCVPRSKEKTPQTATIKSEDTFTFSKNQAVFTPSLISTTSASTSIEGQPKTGLKRKLAGPPFLIYEPVSKSAASGHKLISVRSVDKSTLKPVGTVTRAPKSGVELNELVVQGTKTSSASHSLSGDIRTSSIPHKTQIQIHTSSLQNILKTNKYQVKRVQDGQLIPNICIKTEPGCSVAENSQQFVKITQHHGQLPPTPPSSTSSDNESQSPRSSKSNCKNITKTNGTSTKSSPTLIRVHPSNISTGSLASQLLSSTQRLTQSHGPLILTEEEKRTLIAEGYPVPSKLPLTKSEEKSLKKVRRKIKNKISAQESRRKKKEYVEKLEKKMDIYNKENIDLKRKVDSLENNNRSLLTQLKSLQTLLAGKIPKTTKAATTQTSSCLMMLALSFVFFLGGWLPILNTDTSSSPSYLTSSEDYSSGSMRSRVLMSYKENQETSTTVASEAAVINQQTTESNSVDLESCQVNKWFDKTIKGASQLASCVCW